MHLSPFRSLQLAIVQLPAVSPELVAQLRLLGLRDFVLSLFQIIHASKDLLHVRHPSTPSALSRHVVRTTDHSSPVPLPRLRDH